jgi:prolyl-tRNA synthetase
LIMAHSDDDGLVLPPKLAPIQVVIVPIYKSELELERISQIVHGISADLKGKGISVHFDSREGLRPGFKYAEWELKGVPIRLGIGIRDIENNSIEVVRRDTKEKYSVSMNNLSDYISSLLDIIQEQIYQKALNYLHSRTIKVDSYQEFQKELEGEGGFLSAHWDGTPETEQLIKDETKATIRCIPQDNVEELGVCIRTGKPSKQRVLFARAY